LAPKVVRGLINLRGQILTRLTSVPPRAGEPGDAAKLMNVVVRTDDGPVSFLVDEIGESVGRERRRYEVPPETLSIDLRF